jgi:hypothetical protein
LTVVDEAFSLESDCDDGMQPRRTPTDFGLQGEPPCSTTCHSPSAPTKWNAIAYNAAFYELGLRWHWDCETWSALTCRGADCVRHYLETEQPHLLRAYDAAFLVEAIERAKAGQRRIAGNRGMASAPFDWAQARGCELGA